MNGKKVIECAMIAIEHPSLVGSFDARQVIAVRDYTAEETRKATIEKVRTLWEESKQQGSYNHMCKQFEMLLCQFETEVNHGKLGNC